MQAVISYKYKQRGAPPWKNILQLIQMETEARKPQEISV